MRNGALFLLQHFSLSVFRVGSDPAQPMAILISCLGFPSVACKAAQPGFLVTTLWSMASLIILWGSLCLSKSEIWSLLAEQGSVQLWLLSGSKGTPTWGLRETEKQIRAGS